MELIKIRTFSFSAVAKCLAIRPMHRHSQRGVTLVELLVAMLILTIVCISWLEIIGIQSARKEARRREAVERLAGMMDAFMYWCKTGTDPRGNIVEMGNYQFVTNSLGQFDFELGDNRRIYALFDASLSPVGYQLMVFKGSEFPYRNRFVDWGGYRFQNWADSGGTNSNETYCYWLVGRLYDQNGNESDSKQPFWSVSVCLGPDGLKIE